MYVPVPAPGGAPNGGAGGTRDFEAQDADAAASVRKTVDSLLALPAAADAYLQLLKPQQGAKVLCSVLAQASRQWRRKFLHQRNLGSA